MKKHTFSISGGTKSDQAILIWQNMGHIERFEIMNKVGDYKSIERKHSACIDYIFRNMLH